jgi:glycosyltransferase involved in cell wall biosynthesis
MIALDLREKSAWKLSGISGEKNFILNPGSKAASALKISGSLTLKMLFKSKSGDGLFNISLFDDKNKVFFSKDIRAKKGAWSEVSENIKIPKDIKNTTFVLQKKANSFGRVIVERLSLSEVAEKLNSPLSSAPISKEKEEISYFFEKRKVAIIIPYGIYGGAEVYLKNILNKNLGKADIHIILASKNKISDYLKEFTIINASSLNQIRHIIKVNKYDSIVFYNSKKIYKILVSLKENREINSDLIEIYHSNFVWSDSLSSLDKRVYLSKMIVVSDGLADHIAGDFERKTIPVAIDADLFSKNKNSITRQHIGIKNSYPIFGMVARLSPEKNIDYAIDIFKKIKKSNLLIFGNGPLLQKLSNRIKNESIENVRLMLYKTNMHNYFNLFDALLLTSKMEGTPISIIEGLSFELPIFTTDVGQIRSHFSDSGALNFLTRDLDSDISLISEFLKTPLRHPEAREFVLKNHNKDVNSDLFFKFILGNNLKFEEINSSYKVIRGEWI